MLDLLKMGGGSLLFLCRFICDILCVWGFGFGFFVLLMSDTFGVQKRTSDPLELELCVVVIHCICTRI